LAGGLWRAIRQSRGNAGLKRRILIVATSAVLLLATVYAASPWLLARLLRSVAAGHDIHVRDVELGRPGLRSIDVPRLEFDAGAAHITVTSLQVRYDWRSLVRRRLSGIEAASVQVAVAPSDTSGAGFAPFDPALWRDVQTVWSALPVSSARVPRLHVTTDQPPATLTGAVLLDAASLSAVLEIVSDIVPLPVTLAARVDRRGDIALALAEAGASSPAIEVQLDIVDALASSPPARASELAFRADVSLDGAPLRLLLAFAGWEQANGSVHARLAGQWPLPADGHASLADLLKGRADGDWDVNIDAVHRDAALSALARARGRLSVADGTAALTLQPENVVRITVAATAPDAPVGYVALTTTGDVALTWAHGRVTSSAGIRAEFASDAPVTGTGSLVLDSLQGDWPGELPGELLATGSLTARAHLDETGADVAVEAPVILRWAGSDVAVALAAGSHLRWSQPSDALGWQVPNAELRLLDDVAMNVNVDDATVTAGPAQLALMLPAAQWNGQEFAVDVTRATLSQLDWAPGVLDVTAGITFALASDGWALAPLAVDGATRMAGSLLTSTLNVASPGGWQLPLQIEHDWRRAAGSLRSTSAWHQRGALLSRTFASHAWPFDLDDGRIDMTLHGDWDWSGAQMQYLLALATGLEQGRLSYGETTLHGTSVRVEAELSSAGLVLAPAPFRIAVVDVGFPVTAVVGTAVLTGDAVGVRALSGQLLGGNFSIDTLDFDLAAQSAHFIVDLRGIELAELLLLQGDHVSGSGVLDGRVPVFVEAGAIGASGGHIAARPPGGRIRYAAADAGMFAGQPGLDFALRALGNFTYSELEADVDYTTDGTLSLGVRLLGRNPAVESGRPIQYNLNLTQSVPDLLRSLQLSERLTEQIERHLAR
jgi:hypothetical protein